MIQTSFDTIQKYNHTALTYVPPHAKTNKMSCAPREDADQPGHPPSLIRVFAVRMKKRWTLNYLLSAQSDQTGHTSAVAHIAA